MRVRGEGLADDQGRGLEASDRIVYVAHPNCAIDEM